MEERIPSWLEAMLGTKFFHNCKKHVDGGSRSECNMFCLDCHLDAFCYYCSSSKHTNHHVIQIRRSSYHDVVRVGDVQKMIDISGVQTYTINSARVMFLNQRPQLKSTPSAGKGVSHWCEICARSLLDPLRFCSLGCKLVGVKRNGNTSFSIQGKSEQGRTMRSNNNNNTSSSLINTRQHNNNRSGEEEHHNNHIIISPPSNSRRRKGIPHRAPLHS